MRTLLLTAIVVLFAGLSVPPALAQDGGSFPMPEWGPTPQSDRQGPQTAAQTGPPQLPNNPDPVPVGGALALLALAGGAYAVRRLRRDSD